MIQHLIVELASLLGFAAAYYIARQKVRGEKMVCPFDADCEAVVNSAYSRFLGVPLERLGLFYYSLVFAVHFVFSFKPEFEFGFYPLLLKFTSGGAFVFSLYLIWVQFVRLKNWCFWCLLSSLATLVIFLTSFFLH